MIKDNITIEYLLNHVKTYNLDEVEKIRKAYNYAAEMHKGQKRQSGEDYIIHPLSVAMILSEMHADGDTICAGLLHDTLEDTKATKEEIASLFNADIANLVDGVTKISKLNFSSKQEQTMANTRKIILGITNDVRIIIIKLADRLHNMRTLQYKSIFKQQENALETMEIFVPLAYSIGAYRIKSELEDLSFMYLKPDLYKEMSDKKNKVEQQNQELLTGMKERIQKILNDRNISNEIKIRTKNIYGIYKQQSYGRKLSDIHDLLALKIMVENIEQCYMTLGIVHSQYNPINNKFKDYICNPKTNMYRSLHSTVFGPNDNLVQTQIRTFDMDRIASFGLTAYWDINKGEARNIMQQDLKNRYQFYKSLTKINSMFNDNQEFVLQVKKEVFSNKIYVYDSKGRTIELPEGSTIIDYAYRVADEVGNNLIGAIVNDHKAPINYVLHNKDRVIVITDTEKKCEDDWIDIAHTTYAKNKIKELRK